MNNKIKNIVLDMGNVLFDFNPEFVMNMFCSSLEEKAIIQRELFEGPEWSLGDKGVIKDADRYDLVRKRVPEAYHEALRNCAMHWDVCMKPLPGAKEFCEYVRAHGYGIYILSNASDAFYSYFPRLLPLDFFDGVFVSSDYLMLKPDLEIYQTFLSKYNLKGEECLFIDDRLENVEGAKMAGIQAVQYFGSFEPIVKDYLK